MFVRLGIVSVAMALVWRAAVAQQPGPPELKIDSANRTLAVTGSDSISVEPEIAVLHIGFDTQPEDAKSAYADGARASNAIIEAIKQAGIPEDAIHSESQYLDRDWSKPHKFKLSQQWTVKVKPVRAAEILDIAVTAGATSSGQIEWTVEDEKALEAEALDRAASRARQDAVVLAKSMGVSLGSLIYVSNEVSSVMPRPAMFEMNALEARSAPPPPPLSIEPRQVSRSATVYAVFAIE
ncbi:MAG: SIMPL domain-containing protein [Terracidiphilus sp.]